MSLALRKYLFEAFNTNPYMADRRFSPDICFQIDDQGDYDSITDFVNIFISVEQPHTFVLEITGPVPLTSALADLLEIYRGGCDPVRNRLVLPLSLKQLPVVTALAGLLRDSVPEGGEAWRRHAPRTISSLLRFVRIMHGFTPRST